MSIKKLSRWRSPIPKRKDAALKLAREFKKRFLLAWKKMKLESEFECSSTYLISIARLSTNSILSRLDLPQSNIHFHGGALMPNNGWHQSPSHRTWQFVHCSLYSRNDEIRVSTQNPPVSASVFHSKASRKGENKFLGRASKLSLQKRFQGLGSRNPTNET